MPFAHDTSSALGLAADVVNTEPGRASAAEGIPDVAALETFLDDHRIVPRPVAGLPDLEAVQTEAARALADMARDVIHTDPSSPTHQLAIQVRDSDGPILRASFQFEMHPAK